MTQLQRKQDGSEYFPVIAQSSMDQQHRTTFCVLEGARSSYKPAICMDSGQRVFGRGCVGNAWRGGSVAV